MLGLGLRITRAWIVRTIVTPLTGVLLLEDGTSFLLEDGSTLELE